MLPPVDMTLAPFVCFPCRKSFKRSIELESPPCPDCGGPTTGLSRKFKAPPTKDLKAWRVVEFLVASGFRYHELHGTDPKLGGERVGGYPKTMSEAEAFVVRYELHQTDRPL
jgi:hypothetical protein